MRRLLVLILGAIVFGLSLPSSNIAQKRSRSRAVIHKARGVHLSSVEQFKEAFQNDAGKVRLVALVSPT